MEFTIIDTADNIVAVVFLGRRQIPEVQSGASASVEGMVPTGAGDSRCST